MILIIAYGNSLRRDDGAGLLLGEKLEEMLRAHGVPVELLILHQLGPETALTVAESEADVVVFADSRVAATEGDHPEALIQPVLPGCQAPCLGHHLHPGVVMGYVQKLYGKKPRAWLATVPGVDFGHGEGLSQVALDAVSRLPKVLAEWDEAKCLALI